MNFKNFINFITCLLFIVHSSLFIAKASHFMGGEITWTCDTTNHGFGNGKFHFHMKLYRECASGVTYNQAEILEIINYPDSGKVTKIFMNLIHITDCSPVCNPAGPHITCASANQPNTGAVSEYEYNSDTLANTSGVQLNGHPPSTGWIFAYKSPGVNKRNNSDNLINAATLTWELRAIMYPYKNENGKYVNANPCYDNSPAFAEKPNTVICSGYHFTYNPNASDVEFDSLSYAWAPPLDSSGNQINAYVPGYSYQSPLPGTSINPNNIPASIDPITGEISFTSFTQGYFITVSKVSAFKNKQLVAEIYREMQIVLLPCQNKPPIITPPFKANTSFIDTVFAGQVVNFNLTATDTISQTLSLNASGSDFGSNYSSTTSGCLTPPCATLSPPPLLTGQGSVQASFHWQTDCNHLTHDLSTSGTNHLIYNKPVLSNVHNFVISVQDDYCPVPGKDVSTITIVILNKLIFPAPSLHCVSVTDSGYTNLTWTPVKDTAGSFFAYYLYRSDNINGPYTLLDSTLTITQTTYTDKNVNANKQIYYYYLKTNSACNHAYFSPSSDTLCSMLLTVNPQNGTALITWNSLHSPSLTSSNLSYDLWREFPKGNWQLIASPPINYQLSTNNYIDTIAACSSYINYRIELGDIVGCTSVSSVGDALFHDDSQPDAPVIDTVSIDPVTKKTIIGWYPSDSKDTKKYIILRCDNIGCTPFDTISGYYNTFYLNQNSSPYTGSESYSVAALDSCNKKGAYSLSQNTLFLSASLDICNESITLSWNPYINMSSLEGYRLYYSENNGPFSFLSTITATVAGSSIPTKFVHNNVLPSTNYCYYVKAFDSTGLRTSTSNIRCIVSALSRKPAFAYLRYATVVQNLSGAEYIDVRYIADSSVYISKCVLLRADSLNGAYVPVSTLTNSNLYNITFSDLNVNPDKQSYSYKVEVYDSCGNLSVTSNLGRTILLIGEPEENLSNSLQWNPYLQWDGQVTDYKVYRQLSTPNSQLPPAYSLLANVPPSPPLSYNDDVSRYTLDIGCFTYVVEAFEGIGSVFGFRDSSRSNTALLCQEPKFYIPNAFTPSRENPVFIPVGAFSNPQDYYFAIFNRWGSKVFETTVPNTGWDGNFNGRIAPLGIYVYILRYKDSKGQSHIKNGYVTLLR